MISGVGGGSGVGIEGLEVFELVDGVADVALGGIDHALEAAESAVAEGEGLAESGFGVAFEDGVHLVGEDLGFGDGEAAESPGGADQDIDLVAVFGECGAEALEILVGEGVELVLLFAGDDE